MYFVDESPGLEHYGRKGMKWYQHIYTDARIAQQASTTYKQRADAAMAKRESLRTTSLKAIANRKDIWALNDEIDEALDIVAYSSDMAKQSLKDLLNPKLLFQSEKKGRQMAEKLLEDKGFVKAFDLLYDDEINEAVRKSLGEDYWTKLGYEQPKKEPVATPAETAKEAGDNSSKDTEKKKKSR